MGGDSGALFATEGSKGRGGYKTFAASMVLGLCLMIFYRVKYISENEEGRWGWTGMLAAELWFGFYWIITQSVRWNPIRRQTFKEKLSQRFENALPGVDIFVCTADPKAEPPTMVISTVLSLMAYDYSPEKLTVYLSDDAGSQLTFYALWEASRFARHWIPFCKRFKVEPRSPFAYFSKTYGPIDTCTPSDRKFVKKLYQEMIDRIDSVLTTGKVPRQLGEHKGFAEWNSGMSSRNHQSVVQIIMDGRDADAVDVDGNVLPTVVYMAREKRPQHNHNFKAGAMNALIRVSSEISNSPIILNVDCDMYSNNSGSIRDSLCFFLDEEKGHNIGFVQFPQNFDNLTKGDLYGSSLNLLSEVELHGCDYWGGPVYIGTGCFHRRESLCGRKYSNDYKEDWKRGTQMKAGERTCLLEERAKALATCTYEYNTLWGNEIGLKYGSSVEDVLTGLRIQCSGWRSIYFNPQRKAFLGVAPTTLEQTLVQHKRWSEGNLQIFLSKYCPFIYGHKRLRLGHQMGYSIYGLWAPNSIPTLYYLSVPSLYLLNGISLFPKVSSPWCIPFAYVFVAKHVYALAEALRCGETAKKWWNLQRMWMMKRTTSYLYATIGNVLKLMGCSNVSFAITSKVTDGGVLERYENDVMEFGGPSPMFAIISMFALLNLLCLVGGAKRMVLDWGLSGALDALMFQVILCGLVVVINMPIYEGIFLRKDKGCIPPSITFASLGFTIFLACLVPIV